MRVHLRPVTSGSVLHERLRNSRGGLVLTPGGEQVDDVDTSGLRGPTLLVAPVSDAVKMVSDEGIVVAHVDRATVWQVVAYYLDDTTCHMLASEEVDIERIHQFVVDEGPGWQSRPVEEVFEGSSLP